MGNRVSQALTNWSQRGGRRVRGGCSLHDEGLEVGVGAAREWKLLHQTDSNEIQWVGRQGGAFAAGGVRGEHQEGSQKGGILGKRLVRLMELGNSLAQTPQPESVKSQNSQRQWGASDGHQSSVISP